MRVIGRVLIEPLLDSDGFHYESYNPMNNRKTMRFLI